ncbi:hypothetical protein HFO95_34435 [Rhizobium leguminosarum]|nr:hypothetical protein [Rhizobium leguminosarum]
MSRVFDRLLAGAAQGSCATYPSGELRMVCDPTRELRPLRQRRQIDMALVSRSDSDRIEVLRKESFLRWRTGREPSVLANEVLPGTVGTDDT